MYIGGAIIMVHHGFGRNQENFVHHEGISAFSVWTQCGLLSPQSLANCAEIRFRSAIVPG
jgi:hypothetical protein